MLVPLTLIVHFEHVPPDNFVNFESLQFVYVPFYLQHSAKDLNLSVLHFEDNHAMGLSVLHLIHSGLYNHAMDDEYPRVLV
jgi:hypothetical protein